MMKQSEVFKEIRDRTGIPVTKISTVIGTLTDIVHELAEDDKLTIERLATFTRFRPRLQSTESMAKSVLYHQEQRSKSDHQNYSQ